MRFCRPVCLFFFIFVCVAMGGLPACSEAQERRIIRLKGANAMVNMCDAIGQEFRKTRPQVSVVVQGGTTDQGFEAFCDRKADIVMATRRINNKERQLTAVCGMTAVETQVGRDTVAILVNRSNPVSQLNLEQLGKLLAGEFKSWSDVGGANQPVVVVAMERFSGTSVFLRTFVMNNGYFASEAVIKHRYHELMKEVQRKPSAIGYASLLDARRGQKTGMVKIVRIKIEAESPAVFPSSETLKNGTYPLVRPLYFYWQGPTAEPDVREFVKFVRTKGEKGL